MKKLFPGKNKNNLVGGAAILLIISLIAASPFTVVLTSFAVSPPPPIAKFCSTYKQPNITINQKDCQALVAQVNNSKDLALLNNQTFFGEMLASLNKSLVDSGSIAFTKECNASSFFKTTPPVASCTQQAENFALFLNKIDPGNTWPTQSLKTLAAAKSLLSGTNKIADPKHFVSQANSFNHGLKTILLTGVNPTTDKTDMTGFIGALWIYQSNT